MNTGFDQDKAELGIFVFTVTLEVLPDGDSLTDSYQHAPFVARKFRESIEE